MVLKDVEIISPVLRGVSESIFDQLQSSGFVEGNSGRSVLSYVVCPCSICISDVWDSDFYFFAELEEGILKLDIKNKGYNGDPLQKHPDIYPRDLLHKSIEFFEKQGRRIQVIKGHWVNEDEYSDNYDSYRRYLKSLKREVVLEDRKQAAFQTWTGQRAQELGFTKIRSISDSEEEVVVYFVKS